MKKLTTALLGAALLLSPAAFAQNGQLTNSDFEGEWVNSIPWITPSEAGQTNGNDKVCTYKDENNKDQNATTPTGWCISNVIGMGGLGATRTGYSVDGYNSPIGVTVANTANPMMDSQIVPGFITLGTSWSTSKVTIGIGGIKPTLMDGGTFGGIEYTKRPIAMEFRYKRARATTKPDEKTTIVAYLWKGHWTQKNVPGNIKMNANPTTADMIDRDRCILRDYYSTEFNIDLMDGTQGGEITKDENAELIAVAQITLTENKDEWTLCHIDFDYLTNSTPEYLNIVLAAGDYFGGPDALGVGNSITVDDVNLLYSDDYEGYLNIGMEGGELTRDQESTINILTKSSTKCDFTLPNFTLDMEGTILPLGDINVPDVVIAEENGVKTYNGTAKGLQLLGGMIVADATVTGTIDANDFVNMKIDVEWIQDENDRTPIDVTFSTAPRSFAPTLQINGKDIDESMETITVEPSDKVNFPVVEGIEIHYRLDVAPAAGGASYAPAKVPEGYTKHEGEALDIKPSTSYNLTYIAKDTKTGLESLPKTVSFSTTTGIAAIEAENGSAEYFTLQGVRVAEPTTGIYIRVANGKATKVTVK